MNDDVPGVGDDADLPAIDHPPAWNAVASLAESVGANAKTPHVVDFVNDDGDVETVLTETIRGSSVDEGVGFDDAESDRRVSCLTDDLVRVRPVVDPRTGDAVDADVDLGDLWDYLTIDELLALIDEAEDTDDVVDAV